MPPRWLVAEGILVGCAGAVAIVGNTIAGAWYGVRALADGEGGLVCAAALAVYLCVVRAGRALVGIVVLLGVCLALQAPQAAVGVVLAERGRVESLVVTSVEGAPDALSVSGRARYLCSVADRDGVPLNVRIWRGCERNTRPGDALAVVYDTRGKVPPRGIETGGSGSDPLHGLTGWASALVVACVVAVVRSYRLTQTASMPPSRAVSAAGP